MKYVEWIDPVPGLDKDGNEVTGTQISRMSYEDAINFERAALKRQRPDLDVRTLDPEELLKDFIVIHWAERKEYPE